MSHSAGVMCGQCTLFRQVILVGQTIEEAWHELYVTLAPNVARMTSFYTVTCTPLLYFHACSASVSAGVNIRAAETKAVLDAIGRGCSVN